MTEIFQLNSFMLISGVISFFIGSIPFGYIITKLIRGMDIREHGSKNIGATNVGRVIGWKYGFLVLILDALKGVIPVLVFRFIYSQSYPNDWLHPTLIIGGFSIIGHVYTPFMGFRGGKGVATALGVCLSIIPLTTLGAVFVFFLVYKLFGYVSLGSIIGSAIMPLFYWLFYRVGINSNYSHVVLYVLIGLAIIITLLHRENLIRIYQGKELLATGAGENSKNNEAR